MNKLRVMVAVMFFSGCSSDKVVVVDAHDEPIPGATVQSVSLSMNTGSNKTNQYGESAAPKNIQGTKMIQVSKAGYKTAQVPYPDSWPLKVVLIKERTGD